MWATCWIINSSIFPLPRAFELLLDFGRAERALVDLHFVQRSAKGSISVLPRRGHAKIKRPSPLGIPAKNRFVVGGTGSERAVQIHLHHFLVRIVRDGRLEPLAEFEGVLVRSDILPSPVLLGRGSKRELPVGWTHADAVRAVPIHPVQENGWIAGYGFGGGVQLRPKHESKPTGHWRNLRTLDVRARDEVERFADTTLHWRRANVLPDVQRLTGRCGVAFVE